mmetsp:Transcript_10840/g.27268  ORF Transcript_10840/g.27268 Transcript_10840/m.27268 type:complete len:95 (+) Transcript_10840:34-318(+)
MISVTRTMGDWNIRAFGVSDEPEILSLRLSDRDRLLVLATDGLWDAENTKPDDVVNAARRTRWSPLGASCTRILRLCGDEPADDCSIIVVHFLE